MERYVPLPPLPARISRLNDLASDLWWSWNAPAREVFRDLDYPLWRFTDHNPVLLLHLVEPERLEHAAADVQFLRLYDEAIAALDVVRAGAGTWWSRRPADSVSQIAYVSPEFALHQALPLDSDGRAVAAGDYCKEASDLGVPIIGLGLMYPRGYLHQRLSGEGWQQESYEYIDWSDAPVRPALCPDGSRCLFSVSLAAGDMRVAVWQVRAGRVTIYLLDTDVADNAPWDRHLSSAGQPADVETILRRNVLLGAGAVRALSLLGIEPGMWHLNESASAFVTIARLSALTESGVSWDEAFAQVRETTVYNTRLHAPSPREHVSFPAVERHLAACWPALSDLRAQVLALGSTETDRGPSFNGGTLGARAAGTLNAPPRPRAAVDEWRAVDGAGAVRISFNPGVHLSSWVSREMAVLFESHLGADWREHQDDESWWRAVDAIPDADLWAARQRLRGYLVDFTRERARRRWAREQSSGARLVALGTLLDPATLTIGFARRFTDDIRADVVFADVHRLAAIVTAARRPVQIVFAGKAHAGDETAKHQIQRVFKQALDPMFGGRVAFLEDYDLHAARLLVQGCDLWLTTTGRTGHASAGALKAAVNGVPHASTAAGWMPDSFSGANGWMIDGGRTSDPRSQAVADARALYRILEEEVVPRFYARDRAGIPGPWMQMVRDTLKAGVPRFCARRAVKASVERLYESAPGTGTIAL